MSFTTTAAQVIGISISLVASGGIAGLSLFYVPQLQSQPASRSLPSMRWMFSRGSHIFPQTGAIPCAAFAFLAYKALPPGPRVMAQLLSFGGNATKTQGYLLAAVLAISIWPITGMMLDTNFKIIKMNEEKGGTRSAESASQSSYHEPGSRSAEDSVNSKGEAPEFTDLSGPQTQTTRQTTKQDDEEASELLRKFAAMNLARAIAVGAGGVVGLCTALL